MQTLVLNAEDSGSMINKKYLEEQIPEKYKKDVQTAITLLSNEGCKEIYLFGSLVNGNYSDHSDIDIAVNGIEKKKFFKILGKLMMALEHPVDLVNLDKKDRFSNMLIKNGALICVAG